MDLASTLPAPAPIVKSHCGIDYTMEAWLRLEFTYTCDLEEDGDQRAEFRQCPICGSTIGIDLKEHPHD